MIGDGNSNIVAKKLMVPVPLKHVMKFFTLVSSRNSCNKVNNKNNKMT